MRRVAVLLLALLGLSACGRAAPVVESTAGTTAAVITEEPAATFVPTSGTSNGVRWRTLDLEDEGNAGVKAWLEENHERHKRPEDEEEYRLSAAKMLVQRKAGDYEPFDIWLRDTATGKETLLIKGNSVQDDSSDLYYPSIGEVLNERYFTYYAYGKKFPAGCGVYDTKRLKNISIQEPDNIGWFYEGVRDGAIYLQDCNFHGMCGQMHVYKVALDHLDTMESIPPGENLLEGIPEANTGQELFYTQWLSQKAHYFVVAQHASLRIFNLKTKAFMCKIPWGTDGFTYILFQNENKFYCYDIIWGDYDQSKGSFELVAFERYALEITLP